MISKLRKAALALAATSLVVTPLQANVGDSMDRFMDDMGGPGMSPVRALSRASRRATTASAMSGRASRRRRPTSPTSSCPRPGGLRRHRHLCGLFSFINASEIVALLKAVANNAVGFAFSLAIDTVCPECSKIMQEFAQKAQLMNNLNINSCELAQGLVGGIWPKGDLADKAICEAIGNSEGIFTDYAAAKHGCGTRGQRSTNSGAGRQVRRRQPGGAAQLHLDVLKKSAFFSPNGTFDQELAEYAMTLLGTIIYVPPKDDEPGKFVPIVGRCSSTLVTSLLDGTQWQTSGSLPATSPTSASNPGFGRHEPEFDPRHSGPGGGAHRQHGPAIRTDTAITDAEKELLQVSRSRSTRS
jgi:conjugative transfer pilus assembly protein TraH